MTDLANAFIFFPGSSGVAPDLSVLNAGVHKNTRFAPIGYPGWKRYVAAGFSAQQLISELAAETEHLIPQGPIRIMGHSMGGHFGYAVALHLQSKGREISGFCAVDSFLVTSAAPTAGWQGRALNEALQLLRDFEFKKFIRFTSSRFWRTILRLTGARISALTMRFSSVPGVSWIIGLNPTFEAELSLRLLVRAIAPWLQALDVDPVPLNVPAVLIRTPSTAMSDDTWRRRCPQIATYEIEGNHHTLFNPENAEVLLEAFIPATNSWKSQAELQAA